MVELTECEKTKLDYADFLKKYLYVLKDSDKENPITKKQIEDSWADLDAIVSSAKGACPPEQISFMNKELLWDLEEASVLSKKMNKKKVETIVEKLNNRAFEDIFPIIEKWTEKD